MSMINVLYKHESNMMLSQSERIAALRSEMVKAAVDGYLIPRGDEYLGEYVPPCNERLEWVTGFTGSNGVALLMATKGVLVTDARYGIQVRAQVDRKFFETTDQFNDGLVKFIQKHKIQNITIGFDPAVHGIAAIRNLRAQLDPFGIVLKPIDGNLVDRIWHDRPVAPHSGVEAFLETYAGLSASDKRAIIAEKLNDMGVAAAFLADPTDIAWLLNVRARDLAMVPVALSRAVIYADGTVEWVIDPLRVPLEVKRNLGNAVSIMPPESFPETIMRLKSRALRDPVLVDERMTSYAIAQMMEDRNIILKLGTSPVVIPRACKTLAEQQSIRDAHRRDAVALIRFLSWFEGEVGRGQLDELAVADKVLWFRKQDPAFRGPSFESVSAFGPNSAIMHYRPTPETNKKIVGDGLLLLDSGGQYVGGTTDITRVMAVGTPSEEMRFDYTTVLKGHIQVAIARFPKGTISGQLDTLGRGPIWRAGLDWRHGGHSVGCFLDVHEPGCYVGPLPRGKDVIEVGMHISNEPGTYWEGKYGIRIENMMIVVPARLERTIGLFYELDTVSLVPFDPALTKLSMLNTEEKEWLSAYHTRILDDIGPMLPQADRMWAEMTCRYFMG